jgi:hypothetical protein
MFPPLSHTEREVTLSFWLPGEEDEDERGMNMNDNIDMYYKYGINPTFPLSPIPTIRRSMCFRQIIVIVCYQKNGVCKSNQ